MGILKMFAVLVISCLLIFVIELTDNKSKIELDSQFYDLSYEGILIVTGDWEPYSNKEHSGLLDQIIILILDEASIDFTIKVYPWERAFKMVELGKSMGSYAWAKTPNREGKFHFSDAIFMENDGFFYINDRYDDMTPEAILNDENTVFGMMQAYYHIEFLDPLNPDFSTIEINAIDKLINGRIDGIMLDVLNGEVLIETFYPEYKMLIKSKIGFMEPLELRLIINNKTESGIDYLQAFNKAFDRVKKNGTYHELLEKHGVEYEE